MKTLHQLTAERGSPPAVVDAEEMFNTFNKFVRAINRAKTDTEKRMAATEAFHTWFADRGIFVRNVNWF